MHSVLPEVSIQLATTADIPFIQALAERVWWAHYPEIISDDQITYMLDAWYSASALQEQMIQLGQQFWLITPAGENAPCGYLAMTPKEERGAYYLNKFYLEGRGKGVGEAAFKAVIAQYPDIQKIWLNVNRRNYRSVNFYFKVGFKIESIMDLEVGDRYIMDDYVMVNTL